MVTPIEQATLTALSAELIEAIRLKLAALGIEEPFPADSYPRIEIGLEHDITLRSKEFVVLVRVTNMELRAVQAALHSELTTERSTT